MSDAPRLYREDPTHHMQRLFLDENVYGQAITSFPIVCSDTLVVNRQHRTINLSKRAIKPMKGWWVIGGRRFAGEEAREAAQRNFRKETGLDLALGRFQFLTIVEQVWKDRQQEPQHAGSHNVNWTYVVELTEQELRLARQSIDTKEYEPGSALREFKREELVAEPVHPALVDFYDLVFTP